MLSFENVPGRHNLKQRLTDDVMENKVGNSYVLEGPEGCGKKELAIVFAYMLLCSDEVKKPCGRCLHCKNIIAGGTGEVYKLESEQNKSISVENIRDLQENIYLIPISSKRKAYIIINADEMTLQAQNCILKTLEEPPSYAHIIMTVQDSARLIDTVISRSVILQVGINSTEEIERDLSQRTESSKGEISVAARCASGSYKKAIEILDSIEFKEGRQISVSFLEKVIEKDFVFASKILDDLKRQETPSFFGTISGLLRDMILLRNNVDKENLINIDLIDILTKGANRYPDNVLVRIAFLIEDTSKAIGYNASLKQSFDAMIIKIMEELAKW